jgi:capsular polysaccharide biosynthesis protein
MPPAFVEAHLPLMYGPSLSSFLDISPGSPTSKREVVYLLECANVEVAGTDAAVVAEGNQVLESTTPFMMLHKDECLFRLNNGIMSIQKDDAVEFKIGTFLHGFTTSYHNYAHWVADTLPIINYYAKSLMCEGVILVVPFNIPKFFQEALQLLNIPESSIFRIQRRRVKFSRLYVASLVSLWGLPTFVHDTAREISEKLWPDASITKRRIYLSRADATRRLLLNESELYAYLTQNDIEIVEASKLSFTEQVKLMAQCEIVVGVHGAAMSNIIFCTSGTSVLEIFPEYCVAPIFRSFAARAGLRYGYVTGTCFELEDSREILNSWDNNYVVDIEVVESAISKMINEKVQNRI